MRAGDVALSCPSPFWVTPIVVGVIRRPDLAWLPARARAAERTDASRANPGLA
jgi:hypothetical protein